MRGICRRKGVPSSMPGQFWHGWSADMRWRVPKRFAVLAPVVRNVNYVTEPGNFVSLAKAATVTAHFLRGPLWSTRWSAYQIGSFPRSTLHRTGRGRLDDRRGFCPDQAGESGTAPD